MTCSCDSISWSACPTDKLWYAQLIYGGYLKTSISVYSIMWFIYQCMQVGSCHFRTIFCISVFQFRVTQNVRKLGHSGLSLGKTFDIHTVLRHVLHNPHKDDVTTALRFISYYGASTMCQRSRLIIPRICSPSRERTSTSRERCVTSSYRRLLWRLHSRVNKYTASQQTSLARRKG